MQRFVNEAETQLILSARDILYAKALFEANYVSIFTDDSCRYNTRFVDLIRLQEILSIGPKIDII